MDNKLVIIIIIGLLLIGIAILLPPTKQSSIQQLPQENLSNKTPSIEQNQTENNIKANQTPNIISYSELLGGAQAYLNNTVCVEGKVINFIFGSSVGQENGYTISMGGENELALIISSNKDIKIGDSITTCGIFTSIKVIPSYSKGLHGGIVPEAYEPIINET